MKKQKKILISILLILCLSLTLTNLKIVDAESGWDSDYDYDMGSDWNSTGSDWGSSWDYDSGYHGGSYFIGGFSPIEWIILVIVIIIIIAIKTEKKNKKSTPIRQNKSRNYRELTEEEINAIDPSISKEELKKLAFELYKNIQIAWMNFDYENLRKYTTDELYNMYESQLKVLKAKKQKNIMSDIKYINAKIIDITIENGVEKVKLYLNTITKDYVVNAQNKVVRGSDKWKNNMEYLITLNRNIEKQAIKNCPSCGAEINIISGGKCPYCDSVIVNNNNEFVMSKKECIGQRRES